MYILIFARVVWNPSTKSTKRHSKGAWKHKLMGYKNQVGGGLKPFLFSPLPTGKSSNLILTSIYLFKWVAPQTLMRRVGGVGVTCEVEDHFHGIQNRRRLDLGDRTTDTEVLGWKLLRVSFGNWLIPFMKGTTYIGLEAMRNSSFSDDDLIFPTKLSQILSVR